MEPKVISQEISIHASPKEIYEVFMDEQKHAELISSDAEIDPRVGGEFFLYGGDVNGKTVELEPNEKIVQDWRYNYDDWAEDEFSKIVIDLENMHNGTTTIHFTQTGVPVEHIAEVEKGWNDYYWEPMKKMFA